MSATSWRGKAGWTSTRGRGRRGWGTLGSSTTNPSPQLLSMSALLSLHTQLQMNGTQPQLQLQNFKIITIHFWTFSMMFWCFYWRHPGGARPMHRWRSDIGGCQAAGLLCVYSCQTEVSWVSWVSAADWEYKQHAAVVVSVEWRTVK